MPAPAPACCHCRRRSASSCRARESDLSLFSRGARAPTCAHTHTHTHTTRAQPLPRHAAPCCREEIAGGFEKAYGDSDLPQGEAARLLFLQDPKEVNDIAETRGWKVVGDNYEFPAPEAASKTVPAPDLIERSLSYTLELEKIV